MYLDSAIRGAGYKSY